MKEEIEKALVILESARNVHMELGKRMLEPGASYFCKMDFFALAVFNRSVCLIKGFVHMIRLENFICAAPLLRLQIDNLLRFHAATMVRDPNDFVDAILQGAQIDRIKDANGKPLKDSYILSQLPTKYKELRNLYKVTSGYVHLSKEHIRSAMTVKGSKVTGRISDTDQFVDDKDKLDAVTAMANVTRVLLEMLAGWVNYKRSLGT